MANPLPTSVQRLRYFDGEYLRSYDFTDEQSYHIAMRRLMNRELHLHGIVCGLEIVEDQNSVPGATFFSIASGMAIDQTGREIVVPAPYSLSNLLTGPGLVAGPNEVWICYQESETGLPAAGYLDCNVKNQNTRRQETFSVQFQPIGVPSLFTDCGGVRLGAVTLDDSGPGWQVTKSHRWGRHYVGIRAQEIIAPDKADTDPFDMTASEIKLPNHFPSPGYLRIKPSAVERGNLFVEKNVAIGTGFDINTTTSPAVTGVPADGNLVVTNDLFVQGNFYAYNPNAVSSSGSSGQWWGLLQYIQTLIPVIKTGFVTIPITVPGSVPSPPYAQGVQTVTVNSNLPQVTKPLTILVALGEIDWMDPVTLNKDWLTSSYATATKPLTVSVAGPSVLPSPAPSINLTITATVGPVVLDSSSAVQIPVTSVVANYMVVFTP